MIMRDFASPASSSNATRLRASWKEPPEHSPPRVRKLRKNRDAVANELGEQYGAIFEAHLQMLNDPQLRREIDALIREKEWTPEYAVSTVLRRYAKVFQNLKSSHYMSERASDIFDIEKRLLRHPPRPPKRADVSFEFRRFSFWRTI